MEIFGSACRREIRLQDQAISEPPHRSAPRKWLTRALNLLLIATAIAVVARLHRFKAPDRVDLADISLQRLDGSPLAPQTFQGKAVLLNFWAPWCPPCRAEMPWLNDLQKSDSKIVVLGVEDDPDQYANGINLARTKAIAYPLVRSSQALHQKLPTISVLPTTLFLSRSGRVVHAYTGAIPEVVMRRFAQDAENAQ